MTTQAAKILDRAEAARELMANPMLQDAFRVMRETCVAVWERSGDEDLETRERAWRQLRAVSELERFLRAALENARIEDMRAYLTARNRSGQEAEEG